jgi:Fe2+ transport system protein FeoA
MRTLADLVPGESALVQKVHGQGALARRLADMGFVPGQLVHLVRVAPMGDPLDLQLMGYHLSLRRVEASSIEVQSKEKSDD